MTSALVALAEIVGDALSPLATRLQGDRVEQTLGELGIRLPAGALGRAHAQALQASAAACAPAAAGGGGADLGGLGRRRGRDISAAATLGQGSPRRPPPSPSSARRSTMWCRPPRASPPHRGRACRRPPGRSPAPPAPALISWVEDRPRRSRARPPGAGRPVRRQPRPRRPRRPQPAAVPAEARPARPHRADVQLTRAAYLRELYGWGDPTSTGWTVPRIKRPLDATRTARHRSSPRPASRRCWRLSFFRASPPTPATIRRRCARLRIPATQNFDRTLRGIGGPWSLTLAASGALRGGPEVRIHPAARG